ncbi:hypothetical protein TU85_06145 [Pseudomonas helleri]|uniref:SGNH/GDSL hydrolase family protein n=1 Tax=Pseudomonas helleri TaxID=1608996 RepID=UPI0006540206|nr:SGNH/GDSL hydrolase family protein [Pseudomonas helleri]KMN24053.1 hypothetical protein TU85_06145 [Pseudomonas helleri]
MALEDNVAALTTATTDLLAAVTVSKATLDEKVGAATAAEAATAQAVVSTTANVANAAGSRSQAEAAAIAAQASADDAAAVVTGGDGSLVPAPGKLPIAKAGGAIDPEWLAGTLIGTPPRGFMAGLTQFAKRRVCRVLHVGTSIAANSNSATQNFLNTLRERLGDSGNTSVPLGALGGSTTSSPYLGWDKQPYGGFYFTRIRGKSTSTPLLLKQGLVKRMVLRYSTETDGGSFDVYVDGVFDRTLNCNGAQSYSNEAVFTWSTPGYHTLELKAPASGYAYVESIDYCYDAPGIHMLDGAFGGAALRDYMSLRTNTAPQVPGIAIVGNTGLDSLYNNVAANFKPDAIISTYTVNDAGAGLAVVNSTFKPALDRLVQTTKANSIPLVLVVEMGGHYSMPLDPNYAAYNAVRDHIISKSKEAHVTVIDWHGMMGMKTTDTTELDKAGLRYYNVSSINTATGTVVGDFTHPNDAGYAPLLGRLFALSGVTPTGRQGAINAEILQRARMSSAVPALTTTPYSESWLGLAGFPVELTNALGEKRTAVMAGVSYHNFAGRPEPLWVMPTELNYGDAFGSPSINGAIAAAGTADDYGPYMQMTNYSYYIRLPAEAGGPALPFTITLIVGPGAASVQVRDNGNTAHLPRRVRGVGGIAGETESFNNFTDKPQTYHLTMDPAMDKSYLVLSGKVYAVYITPTEFACIPGRAIETARFLKPTLKMVGDLPGAKVIEQQLYVETINGKAVEKVCIGKGIYKPVSTSWHGLYRLADRTGVGRQRMVLEGTVTVGAYDDRMGGPLISTTSNPQRFKAPTAFTSAHAGQTHTVCGQLSTDDAGIAIYLFNGSNNTYLGLRLDGSWVNDGANSNAAPSLMSAVQDYRGHPVAFTFTLPDAATLGAFNWSLYAAGRSPTANWVDDFIVCEGSSATV